MLPYRDTRLTRIALGLFFVAVIGYGYYELRGILWGPNITVPDTLTTVHEQLFTINGTAIHLASLSMNGNEIPVTEDGAFSHQYLLAPGYNRIVLDAKDKYGTRTQRVVEIMYEPLADDEPPADTATTTPTTDDSFDPEGASSTLDAPLSR